MSSGEAGPSWSRASDTTSTAEMEAVAKSVVEPRPPGIAVHSATTASTAVAKSVGLGEARPLGAAKYRTATKSKFAESPGEFPDVAKSVGEARPPGVAKYNAVTRSEFTASSGEFPDVAESVGEAEPLGVAKYRAATRSELAAVFS